MARPDSWHCFVGFERDSRGKTGLERLDGVEVATSEHRGQVY